MIWNIIWIVIAVLLVAKGIAHLGGKLDGFIMDYNTASEDEKRKYDLKRLRILVALFHFVLAALFVIFAMEESNLTGKIVLACIAASPVIMRLLVRAWAKKK